MNTEESAYDAYMEREFKEWDKVTPVYSETFDRYFMSIGELSDFTYEEEITDDKDGSYLKLILCVPNNLWEIDPDDIYSDIFPEDMVARDVCSKEFEDALKALNDVIKSHKPVSWSPSKYRTV